MTTTAQMLNRAALLALSAQLDILDTHITNLVAPPSSPRNEAKLADYCQQRIELREQLWMCEEVGAEMAEAEEIEPTVSERLVEAIDLAVERGGILVASARRLGRELVQLVPGCEERTAEASIYIVRIAEGELRLTLLDGFNKGALTFRRA